MSTKLSPAVTAMFLGEIQRSLSECANARISDEQCLHQVQQIAAFSHNDLVDKVIAATHEQVSVNMRDARRSVLQTRGLDALKGIVISGIMQDIARQGKKSKKASDKKSK